MRGEEIPLCFSNSRGFLFCCVFLLLDGFMEIPFRHGITLKSYNCLCTNTFAGIIYMEMPRNSSGLAFRFSKTAPQPKKKSIKTLFRFRFSNSNKIHWPFIANQVFFITEIFQMFYMRYMGKWIPNRMLFLMSFVIAE